MGSLHTCFWTVFSLPARTWLTPECFSCRWFSRKRGGHGSSVGTVVPVPPPLHRQPLPPCRGLWGPPGPHRQHGTWVGGPPIRHSRCPRGSGFRPSQRSPAGDSPGAALPQLECSLLGRSAASPSTRPPPGPGTCRPPAQPALQLHVCGPSASLPRAPHLRPCCLTPLRTLPLLGEGARGWGAHGGVFSAGPGHSGPSLPPELCSVLHGQLLWGGAASPPEGWGAQQPARPTAGRRAWGAPGRGWGPGWRPSPSPAPTVSPSTKEGSVQAAPQGSPPSCLFCYLG